MSSKKTDDDNRGMRVGVLVEELNNGTGIAWYDERGIREMQSSKGENTVFDGNDNITNITYGNKVVPGCMPDKIQPTAERQEGKMRMWTIEKNIMRLNGTIKWVIGKYPNGVRVWFKPGEETGGRFPKYIKLPCWLVRRKFPRNGRFFIEGDDYATIGYLRDIGALANHGYP